MTENARSMPLIFAADIGATNSRFALFSAAPEDESRPPLCLERERWLKGAEYGSFTEALAALRAPGADGAPPLLDGERLPDMAVIAPAGPVTLTSSGGERCRISNLPWLVDSEEAGAALGIRRVRLINDFAAQAYACLLPENANAVPILPGRAVDGAPVAVAGAGTGFGQALLLREAAPPGNGERRAQLLTRLSRARILPSEGGHKEFPFVGGEEAAFARFAAARAGVERLIGDAVVSGSGLAHIVAFLTGESLHPYEATRKALENEDCLDWFARFYGRACRLYALDCLCLGGFYVTGGMALRLPALTRPAFAAEFHESAAQRPLLEGIPVFHMQNPQAGLWGAALFGLLHLNG